MSLTTAPPTATTIKEAMALLASAPESEQPVLSAPSKLGTQAHWDEVYEREVRMFKECGDEGEVWFGEDSAEQMVDWMEENRPDKDARIIDLGCGNGHLLQLLHLAGYTNLLGVDYSQASIDLALSISEARGVSKSPSAIRFEVRDIFTQSEQAGEKYDVVLDKGTYDAISLSDETRGAEGEEKLLVQLFPAKVRELIAQDGVLLITSCNFTRPELEKSFISAETGFKYLSHIPRPTFSYGGAIGQTITTIAFSV